MSELSAEDRERLEGWAENMAAAGATTDAETVTRALALIDQQAAKIESYEKALSEAVADLANQQAALEAADELARIANAHAHPQVVGAKYPLRAAYIAYRSTRTTTEGEDA